jgi:glutamate dehydrogenase/leucine dehydrogenase
MSNTVFQLMQELEHEQIVICNDPHSKLKAIIAIHNTTLGTSIGRYPDVELYFRR